MIAIIPARGGSKGIPRKNLQLLKGQPLISYSIEAALKSECFDRVLVSTEDPEIAEVSVQWGAEVIERPAEMAGDLSLSSDVVAHVLEALERPPSFCLLQPTSPLRTAEHLRQAFAAFSSPFASLLSVCEAEHHPYKGFIERDGQLAPLAGVQALETPRQSLPRFYRQNGAIYMGRCETFLAQRSFYIDQAHLFIMDRQASLDIDHPEDLERAAELISSRRP